MDGNQRAEAKHCPAAPAQAEKYEGLATQLIEIYRLMYLSRESTIARSC